MPMSNREWKAMQKRHAAPAMPRVTKREFNVAPNKIYWERYGEFAVVYRIQDEMAADRWREMNDYYSSNEDL